MGSYTRFRNDGWDEPEGHSATADRRQDHLVRRQGPGWEAEFRGVQCCCREHGCACKDGGRGVASDS